MFEVRKSAEFAAWVDDVRDVRALESRLASSGSRPVTPAM